jgi:hypothetical protein
MKRSLEGGAPKGAPYWLRAIGICVLKYRLPSNALRAVGCTLGCTDLEQAQAFVYLCTWGEDDAMP